MSRSKLYTIGPHGCFLDVLAARVLDGTLLGGRAQEGAFWLSDVTIVLPTKRAQLALASIFADRLGGAALLPDIRTFGGEKADEEPFLPPIDAPNPPPPASLLERRLILARLIDDFAHTTQGSAGFASPPNAAEILWLADSLAQLIDDLEIEGVSHRALRDLVPEELAANWQDTITFLEIVLSNWPKILKSLGKADAALLRNERLARQAKAAPLLYGDRPVIAAGSTGSIPATAKLLGAIAKLKRGAIVLPGLDTTLTSKQHEALLDPAGNAHGHPQYALALLLRSLGAGPAEVDELVPESSARTALVRAALALPDDTANWTDTRQAIGDVEIMAATSAISILAAPNADIEARAVALAARQALVRSKSVGIISPDQNLARRIAAELSRHGIEVADSAGTPIYQAAVGRLARQALALAANAFDPVHLISLLRNRAVTLDLGRAHVARATDILDLKLRGERVPPGIAGLRTLLGRKAEKMRTNDVDDIGAVLDRLEQALAPICALVDASSLTAGELAMALELAIARLAGEAPDLPGLDDFTEWANEVGALANGPVFPPRDLDGVLAALMNGTDVRGTRPRRDDIAIWGALEARLLNADLIILAGVNEDIWPRTADPGPWLSRKMRIDVGLAPPERQQGQSAHDFEMALGNAEVMIAYADRLGTSPALPSRLLQRVTAFAGKPASDAMRARGAVWVASARALDRVAGTQAAAMPMPSPPASARPRRLSVTEIETLMRSPYDLYAKHVLHLRRIDALGAVPDARERGTMIHDVFAKFVAGHDVNASDAPAILEQLAKDAFTGLDGIGERRDIWLKRFAVTAQQFLAYERARDGNVAKRHAEQLGDWVIPTLQNFVLRGRADRLDVLRDGTIEIIDFKTGTIPSAKEMRAFDAPQLLLEAAMARAGAFSHLAAGKAGALTYIKIGLGPDAFTEAPFKIRDGQTLDDAVDEVVRRMQGHVEQLLLRDDRAMLPRIRPAVNRTFSGDYEHLARTDEWTLTAGDDT